ncbi:GNAT family N-acetyltransferase [Clavibacter tessellarius]|uniref:GNAT family N-acetyltransferase n=1 Tax=Clavibacter tessellarius TaxID=31965 RepID=UPI00324B9042
MTAVEAAIRPARADDLPFLEDMLLASMDWRDDRAMTRERMLATPEPRALRGRLAARGRRRRGRGASPAVPSARHGRASSPTTTAATASSRPTCPSLGMALVPSARGRGLGRRMLGELVAAVRASGAPAVSLSVEDGNDRARALYASLGFVPAGREGGSDVLLLRW